jgi:hypothetical protein
LQRLDDYILVSCRLPGEIRQIGTSITYLSPRKPQMLTKRECARRGGEFVLFDRSDYRAALGTLLPKARGGDALAQTYVGEIYAKGLGLPAPDPGAAAIWYRKAANQGNPTAQMALGSLYERGLGVPQNKAEALNLYRQALGIDEDRLEFRSQLDKERAELRREIAKRRQIAGELKRQKQSQPVERQLVSQALDAESRAEQLRLQAEAAQALRKNTALQAEVERLKKLELALKESSDLMFDTAQAVAATR